MVDQIGFYFISSSSRKLKAKEICPLVNELEKKGKRKKNRSKIFAKCVPREKFSWFHNKPLVVYSHTNIDLLKIPLCFFEFATACNLFPPLGRKTAKQNISVLLQKFKYSSPTCTFQVKLINQLHFLIFPACF